jgi:hypothetical protein
MEDRLLGAGRLFASHYQIVVCDDPSATISDDANWSEEKFSRGFAGTPTFRMSGSALPVCIFRPEVERFT